LIEDVPWNKLQQSNTFSTTWVVVSGASVTSGQSGYDGTNNAWLLEKTAANKYIQQQLTFVGTNTFSVYIKANTTNWVALMRGDGQKAFFNLSGSGSTGSVVNGISSNIESISNGWFRCSFTFENSSTNYARIYPADGNNDTSGTSGSIYIQDAQLNKGTTAKTYFPTTDRLNVPRIDYTGGGCGKLLLEPQRTNTILQSVPNGSYFTLTEITMDLNSATSPDGENNAVRLTPTTVSSSHRMYKSSQPISGGRYSVFAKSNGYDYILLTSHPGSAPSARGAYFNIANGTIGSEGNGIVAEIEDYGNGWFRCIINAGTSASSIFSVFAIEADGTTTFAGDGTKGVYIWGAQNEQGDYASSYIPTSGATATRVGDVCNGAGTSATFNSTEGVLYAETKASVHNGNITLSNGSNNDNLIISLNLNSGRIDCNMKVGGAYQFIFNYTTDMSINHKIAVRYKTNDFALFVDGTKVLTDTSGITPTANTLNELNFSSANQAANFFYGNTKQLMTFNTALTDAELETLTTL
jgi:hypothetical protein